MEERLKQLEGEVKALQSGLQSLSDFSRFPSDVITVIKRFLPIFSFAEVTLDFANVLSGASSTATVTVNGVVPQDFVALSLPNAEMGTGRLFTAWVSAQDTVTIQFDNQTGGAINLNSAVFGVMVIKKT